MITAVATQPDPYPFYATLIASRPVGRDEDTGLWVAADAAAVSSVLGSPACVVRPPAEPVPHAMVGTPAGDVFGRLVRMTDGATHARRKRALLAALGSLAVADVRALAAAETEQATDWPDVQFGVPVRVLARLLGVAGESLAEIPGLVGEFVRCIPASAGAQDRAAASQAAVRLLDLLASRDASDAGEVANRVGLLTQTYEATAGLIGSTLLMLAREPWPADLAAFVGEVARYDSPVQNTRRFARAELHLNGHVVPAGAEILVLLAAANRDPLANPDPHAFRVDRARSRLFSFGRAAHECPGRALATAITAGIATAVRETPGHTGYRASPNLRIPLLAGWSA